MLAKIQRSWKALRLITGAVVVTTWLTAFVPASPPVVTAVHQPAWSIPLGPDNGPVSASEGRAVVGTVSEDGEQALLVCVSVTSGVALWTITHDRLLPPHLDNPANGIRSRAAITDGQVTYYSNRAELICCSLKRATEPAVDDLPEVAGRPAVSWRRDFRAEFDIFKRDDFEFGTVSPSPQIIGEKVYCATGNGSTHGIRRFYEGSLFVPAKDSPACVCLSMRDGSLIWSHNESSQGVLHSSVASPTVLSSSASGEAVSVAFAGGDGRLRILSDHDGSTLAISKEGIWCWSWCPPALCGDVLAIATDVPDGLPKPKHHPIHGFKIADFKSERELEPLWTFVDEKYAGTYVEPIHDNGVLFVLAKPNFLLALESTSGELLWSDAIDYEVHHFAGMALASPYLLVAVGNSVFCYESSGTRRLVKQTRVPGLIQGGIAVSDGHLLFCTRRHLNAIKLENVIP